MVEGKDLSFGLFFICYQFTFKKRSEIHYIQAQ